jgi:hypothetical protein
LTRERTPSCREIEFVHPTAGGTPFRDVTGYDAEVIVELDEAAPLPEWSERWLRPLLDLLVFANREQCVVDSFVAVIHDPALAEAVGPAIRIAAPDSVCASARSSPSATCCCRWLPSVTAPSSCCRSGLTSTASSAVRRPSSSAR